LLDLELTDRVVVVTGGASNIGRGIVHAFAQQGANVVIDYVVHPEATEEEEKQILAMGQRAIGVKADVSKDEAAKLKKQLEDAGAKVEIKKLGAARGAKSAP